MPVEGAKLSRLSIAEFAGDNLVADVQLLSAVVADHDIIVEAVHPFRPSPLHACSGQREAVHVAQASTRG